MNTTTNGLGQPIGAALPDWRPPPAPSRRALVGNWAELAPIDPPVHAAALHEANSEDTEGRIWTYLNCGPFADLGEYVLWMQQSCLGDDPLFFAIRDKEQDAWVGVGSYLRIQPEVGCIEVGHLCFSPRLQRRRAATEAMYLMMREAFDLGYRRYEWKCDSLNAPSRRAAIRLGFTFDGIFRQATVYKGRNRDTAWYSITDGEWPGVRRGHEAWQDAQNFTADGTQIERLEACLAANR